MSESTVRFPVPQAGLNGELSPAKPRKARKQADKPAGKRPARRKGLALHHKAALAAGGAGVSLMALSVAHCTEAISLLTGSHWALSGLLAIGIDAGMVASELAELTAHGTSAQREVSRWANAYIVVAVLLSVLLNAYAFSLHAPAGMQWAAVLLGVVIPGLMYAAGRYAGRLWLAE
ncbi:MAG: hypothetical protein JNM56_29045 [Planctomycetia bacterium]|nr:hypothetical protein [Planctomycetia bacterium]